ncbi:MAG: [acyl-carrier-protein] S-malonyltransferase [Acidobacteriaceae bacterium]|jgi:[acyl-carrier-protein] S-malonyltransferase|nr:[acyl-carrier-protein] S-malonyltransferase [Acidobacteriaceae bacterium]
MGRDLASTFPVARQTFEEANDALGFDLASLCFQGPEEQLRLTEFTQPAIFTVSVAVLRVLAEAGVTADFAAGHSLGEYSANVAAGAIDFAAAARTVRRRGQLMQQAVPAGQGSMAAILGMPAEALIAVCRDASSEGAPVQPANLNSPEQIVISGATAAVERAVALAKERGAKRAVLLQVSAPFHCSLMQPAQDGLSPILQEIPFSAAKIPVVVNVDAALLTDGARLRDALIRQVTGAVRWTESMQLLIAEGVTTFIEVGPGKVLSGLMRQIDRSQKCAQVEDPAGLEKLLAGLNG